MNINQLETFQVVAKTCNLAKAADILYTSQPALSRIISRLEAEIGVQLFDRINNRIQLNSYGKEFLTYVNTALSILEDGKRHIADMTLANTSIKMLDCGHSLLITFLLNNFILLQQGITIEHDFCHGNDVVINLLERNADFIVTCYPQLHADIECDKLGDLQLYACLNQRLDPELRYMEHPIPLPELMALPIVLAPKRFEVPIILNHICSLEGYRPKVIRSSIDFGCIYLWNRQGIAAGFTTFFADATVEQKQHFMGHDRNGYITLVDSVHNRFPLYILYLRGRYMTQCTRGFIKYLKQAFAGAI